MDPKLTSLVGVGDGHWRKSWISKEMNNTHWASMGWDEETQLYPEVSFVDEISNRCLQQQHSISRPLNVMIALWFSKRFESALRLISDHPRYHHGFKFKHYKSLVFCLAVFLYHLIIPIIWHSLSASQKKISASILKGYSLGQSALREDPLSLYTIFQIELSVDTRYNKTLQWRPSFETRPLGS